MKIFTEKEILIPEGKIIIEYKDFPKLDTETKRVFIPNGCEVVEEYAFRNLPMLYAVFLPMSLKVFDINSLSGAEELEYIIVHDMLIDNDCSIDFEYPKSFIEIASLFSESSVSNDLEKYRLLNKNNLKIVVMKCHE